MSRIVLNSKLPKFLEVNDINFCTTIQYIQKIPINEFVLLNTYAILEKTW